MKYFQSLNFKDTFLPPITVKDSFLQLRMRRYSYQKEDLRILKEFLDLKNIDETCKSSLIRTNKYLFILYTGFSFVHN